MKESLAFIGLGVMGEPMAGHLLAAGYPLTVHTRSRAKAEGLIARGAKWADSPGEAARGADVVFICVTDTPDVQAVVFGSSAASSPTPGQSAAPPRAVPGILDAARQGMIVVDHSTISPSATRAMAAELSKRGVKFLDAPISGGDVGARNATLAIMVGGDQTAFDRVEPILKVMGKTITHCGPSGAGQLTKLVNQILVSVTNLAVSEALTFARKNGLDLEKTIAAVAAGAAGSWQLANLGPKMAAGDFRPGFAINLQQKDLKLILAAALEAKTPVAAASLVHQLFTAAQADGRGKEGTQALFTVLQKLAGL